MSSYKGWKKNGPFPQGGGWILLRHDMMFEIEDINIVLLEIIQGWQYYYDWLVVCCSVMGSGTIIILILTIQLYNIN